MTLVFGSTEANQILERDRVAEKAAERARDELDMTLEELDQHIKELLDEARDCERGAHEREDEITVLLDRAKDARNQAYHLRKEFGR